MPDDKPALEPWMTGPKPQLKPSPVARGAAHYKAVFKSDEQVRQLKVAAKYGGWTARQLSVKFNVNIRTIQSVLSGRTWKHIVV